MVEQHNHIREKVENDDPTGLTEQQAKEQLAYSLRDQVGRLTFETKPDSERDTESHGDGIVVAKINGEQVDHYIYNE